MRRCGELELHEAHGECDGRTPNEPLVGQCTVRDLHRAIHEEQGGALVCVEFELDGRRLTMPLAVPAADRDKGKPVVTLRPWQPQDWMPYFTVPKEDPS